MVGSGIGAGVQRQRAVTRFDPADGRCRRDPPCRACDNEG